MGASVDIQLVSTHRKSVRQKKSFVLEEFNFNEPIRLRLFTLQDCISITIKQENDKENYLVLTLANLPLKCDDINTLEMEGKIMYVI
jgi:hypothetical protein